MINKNLLKLPRSDSIDQIVDKLNQTQTGSSVRKYQDQSVLNWFSLKFNDQNKELEYF